MNERYWFVVVDYNSKTMNGKQNMGFVSSDECPFSNVAIKKAIVENNPEMEMSQIVVISFQEFKSKSDYVNFWAK